MSKLGKMKKAKDIVQKVIRPSFIDINIPAGSASVGPPLGPILGDYGLPINKFAADFNELTKDIKKGTPLPTRIHVDGKKYKIQLYEPCVKFLIRQAAGIKKGSENPENIVGKVTHRHVYEIARVKVKQENYKIRNYSMELMCKEVIKECYHLGVKVVKDLDPDEYQVFLEDKRREEEELQRKLEQEIIEARKKLSRK